MTPPIRWKPIAVATAWLAACLAPSEERITCDDTLPPEQASFAALQTLVTTTAANDKGCSDSDCHGSDDAEYGYRFDEPAAIYDAFTTHIDSVYAQVATGEMPPSGAGSAWSEEDLLLVRSWYCNGGFPDE